MREKILFCFFLFFFSSFVIATDYNNGLTYSIADLRYCRIDGNCSGSGSANITNGSTIDSHLFGSPNLGASWLGIAVDSNGVLQIDAVTSSEVNNITNSYNYTYNYTINYTNNISYNYTYNITNNVTYNITYNITNNISADLSGVAYMNKSNGGNFEVDGSITSTGVPYNFIADGRAMAGDGWGSIALYSGASTNGGSIDMFDSSEDVVGAIGFHDIDNTGGPGLFYLTFSQTFPISFRFQDNYALGTGDYDMVKFIPGNGTFVAGRDGTEPTDDGSSSFQQEGNMRVKGNITAINICYSNGTNCPSGGNSSFNQSYTDSLYYSLLNPYGFINWSIAANGTLALNSTFAYFLYITDQRFNETSLIKDYDNATIIRTSNTTWITNNQNYNTSAQFWAVANNNTFQYLLQNSSNITCVDMKCWYNGTIGGTDTYNSTIDIWAAISNATFQFRLLNSSNLTCINNQCWYNGTVGAGGSNTSAEVWNVVNNQTFQLRLINSSNITIVGNQLWYNGTGGGTDTYNSTADIWRVVNNQTFQFLKDMPTNLSPYQTRTDLVTNFTLYQTRSDLVTNLTSYETRADLVTNLTSYVKNATSINMSNTTLVSVFNITFANGGGIWSNGTHICIGSC